MKTTKIDPTLLVFDYYEFFKWAFAIMYPKQEFHDEFHIKFLCNMLTARIHRTESGELPNEKDLIINMPPQMGASSIFSVLFCPWIWLRQPKKSFLIIGEDTRIIQHCEYLVAQLFNSPEFKDTFKWLQVQYKGNIIENNDRGYIKYAGIGEGLGGLSANYVIVDSPQNLRNLYSRSKFEEVYEYIHKPVRHKLRNGGLFIYVAPKFTNNDLSLFMRQNNPDTYEHILIPATSTYNNAKPAILKLLYHGSEGLLSPKRLSKKVLENIKIQLGEIEFDARFNQIIN